MISVSCSTNIDKFKNERWPTTMCCRPQLGDEVASFNGVRLTVVNIVHAEYRNDGASRGLSSRSGPYLAIDLHMTNGTIPV